MRKIKIAKGTPLLPGHVYLFRDGTFVGTGDMPLLQPGEDHDLGFGVDDQVKVKHAVLEEKRGESGLISTSHVDSRNFRVSVKNLHERPIDVTDPRSRPGVAERRDQSRVHGRVADDAERRRQARRHRVRSGGSSRTKKRCSNTAIESRGRRRSRSSTDPERASQSSNLGYSSVVLTRMALGRRRGQVSEKV